MSELTPQARAFLRAHRHDGEPSPEDAQRVRAALEVSLAGAAGVGAAAWVTRLTLVKWGLVLTLGLGGAALLVHLNSRGVGPVTEAAPVRTQHQPAPLVQPPDVVVEALDPPAPPAPPLDPAPPSPVVKRQRKETPAAVLEAPAPVSPPEPTSEPAAEAPPAPVSPVTAPLPAAEDELVLVSRAQELLGEGRPRDALEVLTRWEVHFASTGQFAEEALAARAVALCLSGNLEQGRAVAKLYLEKYPASPQRNRIERACP
ncbi:MAG: hypothetical protein Q8L48_09955 [Archangium sp.]|nr:hypothetical protein [Archangium sp.]